MRIVLVVMFVVVALIAAWYFVQGGTPSSPPPPPAIPALALDVIAPAPDSSASEPVIAAPSSTAREAAPNPDASSEPAIAGATDWPRARVFGRLVDDQQTPAADVSVRLSSVGDPWAPGQQAPVVERRGYKIEEFSTNSTADGRFELDVPVPTAEWISLYVNAPDYLGLGGKDFGPAGGRNQPRIVAGDNDVGVIVLAITGAVSGEVRAVDGSPVARADIGLEGSYFPGGYGVGSQSDANGRFVLGHVPEGTWTVSVNATGFLSTTIANVEVKRRATTPGLDFRLERAPTISGRVVDEDGRPLEKMWIYGWPLSSGRGAGATSKADGSFVIHLPQNEPYRLELEERSNRGRFEPWGGHASKKVFDPGATDVLVQLKRAVRTTFVVVDAQSGAPIEKYAVGLSVRPDPSSNTTFHSSQELETEPRPKGECTLAADPKRHRVQIVAPGYEDVETDVVHDAGVEARQTLRMKPGAVFVGRVRHAGEPVAHAKLAIVHDYIKIDPSKPDDGDPWFDDNYTTDLGEFLGRWRRLESAIDGSFRIPDLPPGTYALTITGGKGAPKTVKGLRIESGATRDLGEISLDDAGALHGRIAIGPGQETMRISVQVDEGWGPSPDVTGAQREFTIPNLTIGEHKLYVSLSGAGLQDGTQMPFTIEANKTTEIVVDLSDKSPCKARIRVTSHEKPRAGIDVEWQSVVDGRAMGNGKLGTTDEHGFATGNVSGGIDAVFVAKADSGFVIGRTAVPVRMGAGAFHEAVIESRSGDLVIELPASLEIPDDGSFSVVLTAGEMDWQSMSWSTPHAQFHEHKNRWTSRHCVIGAVAPGVYELQVDAQKLVDSQGYVPLMENFASTITIKEGETLTVEIKP
jgi:hypothetical protein